MLIIRKTALLIIIAAIASILPAAAEPHRGDKYEQTVMTIVGLIEQGRLEQALQGAEKLIVSHPKSRIGYLLKADVLAAMGGELPRFAGGVDAQSLEYRNFHHELKNRFASQNQQYDQKYQQLFPASVLDMGQHQYLLLGEMSTGRFFIFSNLDGKPQLLHDYYMTIGKEGYGKEVEGDNRTPIGLYHITHEIDGKELPDLYGSGAFPVNYPNRVDKWRGRTGYGIWLHGTPSDTYARAPLASEGCFVISNDDYDHVANYIREVKKPPVLLVETVDWLTPEQHSQRRQEFLSVLSRWANDWESLDVERYLQHYEQSNFNFGKGDFAQWSERKRQVGKAKEFIQLSIEVNGLFLYPGEDMFVVDFQQGYFSNNYESQSAKKQYWKKTANGEWKIIFEG